jgi:hypothetical protein
VNAGERAARERVEAVYAAVDELTSLDLRMATVAARDMETREVLLADLERQAGRVGRGALLDEARGWLRDAISARAATFVYNDPGLPARPASPDPDQLAAVVVALSDTVSVAVAEDLVSVADAAALAGPGRRLLGMDPLPGSAVEPEPHPGAWQPSAADWTAAAGGPQAVDRGAPMAGNRSLQRGFFAVVGLVGAALVALWGLTTNQLWLGILGAAAVLALAWTFATWRPLRG